MAADNGATTILGSGAEANRIRWTGTYQLASGNSLDTVPATMFLARQAGRELGGPRPRHR
ncbi:MULTISPECIES: hypothetical protein [Amycolatopsis]|uniref:hypothetical protein n=1 Tax=Amycolatopsis TaxID=1813 RepID=UPI001C587EFE|nr:hypothetical protein [Amycolatopsis sp. TNS106]QXV62264.1 hypothetical protein CVV72_38255 [Amycolatopsis sp. TNS106]